MKLSVIISACDNRDSIFGRSLDTWAQQSMPKEDFEIIVVDDAMRESLRQLCQDKSQIYGLNIRFIRIDKSKSHIPVKTFIPVLTNNVGFRNAQGEVSVITGPETLQASGNLDIAWTLRDRRECAYGLVFKASVDATNYITMKWGNFSSMDELLLINGAQEECVTRPPHPPSYWYFLAVATKHVISIGGVDERFLGGLCREDDDFSHRMRKSGITPVFEPRIVGLHQNHSREDANDGIHISRMFGEGFKLLQHNDHIMKENIRNPSPVVNAGHEWGSKDLIILDERFGGK